MKNRIRILIVDDEPDMLRSLRRIFKLKGYEVATASSGEEAVETAQAFNPDGVLMDVRMPGIDGLEAYRRIRARRPDIFVCFMTAHSDLAYQAEEEGNRVLTKPLDIEEMCAFVAAETENRPVLIVDDDPQFSSSLKRVLREEGFQIDVAPDVDAAIEIFSQRSHAIVVLDLQLGANSGWDLVPTLRRRNPDVCVIAISGRTDFDRVQEDDGVAFMPKPLDLEQLISAIHDTLQRT